MSKRKIWQRRHLASKMTITHQQPWPMKLAMSLLLIALIGAVAWWTYDLGRNFAFGPQFNQDQVQSLRQKLELLTAERDQLRLEANTIDSKINIDRSMQKELTEQVKTLTAENQKLKDDLAFFEGLMPSATGTDGVALQNLKVEVVSSTQIRYRALVMQGVKNGKDFSGELQFSLGLVQAGKPVTMLFPDPKTGDAGKLKLSFRHYQRVEGLITLPDGTAVKSVLAKVLDKGQIRAQQTVNL
ncbi:DUF6776 family protein [Undibacterium oligocarboniphilum]|nr:DUF6776 family protein [Undibacterium oligocarboniphilum]MBC3869878.1 hypothetical protein [Undibacterium oligocarboniphilum]